MTAQSMYLRDALVDAILANQNTHDEAEAELAADAAMRVIENWTAKPTDDEA